MACSTRFIKGCAGKVKHKTSLGAEYALSENRQNKNAEVYKCTECGFFHIGTQAKKKSKILKIDIRQKDDNGHNRKYKTIRKMKY